MDGSIFVLLLTVSLASSQGPVPGDDIVPPPPPDLGGIGATGDASGAFSIDASALDAFKDLASGISINSSVSAQDLLPETHIVYTPELRQIMKEFNLSEKKLEEMLLQQKATGKPTTLTAKENGIEKTVTWDFSQLKAAGAIDDSTLAMLKNQGISDATGTSGLAGVTGTTGSSGTTGTSGPTTVIETSPSVVHSAGTVDSVGATSGFGSTSGIVPGHDHSHHGHIHPHAGHSKPASHTSSKTLIGTPSSGIGTVGGDRLGVISGISSIPSRERFGVGSGSVPSDVNTLSGLPPLHDSKRPTVRPTDLSVDSTVPTDTDGRIEKMISRVNKMRQDLFAAIPNLTEEQYAVENAKVLDEERKLRSLIQMENERARQSPGLSPQTRPRDGVDKAVIEARRQWEIQQEEIRRIQEDNRRQLMDLHREAQRKAVALDRFDATRDAHLADLDRQLKNTVWTPPETETRTVGAVDTSSKIRETATTSAKRDQIRERVLLPDGRSSVTSEGRERVGLRGDSSGPSSSRRDALREEYQRLLIEREMNNRRLNELERRRPPGLIPDRRETRRDPRRPIPADWMGRRRPILQRPSTTYPYTYSDMYPDTYRVSYPDIYNPYPNTYPSVSGPYVSYPTRSGIRRRPGTARMMSPRPREPIVDRQRRPITSSSLPANRGNEPTSRILSERIPYADGDITITGMTYDGMFDNAKPSELRVIEAGARSRNGFGGSSAGMIQPWYDGRTRQRERVVVTRDTDPLFLSNAQSRNAFPAGSFPPRRVRII